MLLNGKHGLLKKISPNGMFGFIALCLIITGLLFTAEITAFSLLSDVQAEEKKLEYRLGPEDILEIYVDRHNDLSRVVVVGPDGKISLPLIGDVMAQSLTRTELQKQIATKFKDFITDPMVTVLIQSFNSFKVYVLGQVNRPGLYSLKGKPFLMEAISMANGFTDFANTEDITIRKNGEIKKVDVNAYLQNKEALGRDFMLQAGDTVFVSKLEHEKKVFVLGEVNMPGAYELKRKISLLEALALAGSYKSTSNLDDIVIERRTKVKKIIYHVNLGRVLDEGDLAQNIDIFPGDSIYVPRGSMRKIMVLGEVASPGVYEFNRGMTVLEGVSTAGSYTTRAVLRKAAVIRGSGPSREIIKVDLDKIIHEGRLSENVELAAGDVIYVPETLEPDWAKNILPMLESLQIGRDLVKNW